MNRDQWATCLNPEHLPGGWGGKWDDVEVCSGFYQPGAAFSSSLGLCVYVGKLGLSQGLKLRLRGCPAHMFTQHGVEEFTWQAVSRFWSCNRKSEPQAGLQRAQPPNSTEPNSLSHTHPYPRLPRNPHLYESRVWALWWCLLEMDISRKLGWEVIMSASLRLECF